MSSTQRAAHRRDHRSVLAALEKKLLIAIARRLPRWVSSDLLTLFALASMGAAGLAFAHITDGPWSAAAVVAALAANWFGDSLDGTLARVRGHERPGYGFYVDHVVDLMGITALVAGMGASGAMRPIVAAAVLAGYVLVAAETFLATHASGVFRLSFGGIGGTELRLLLAVAAVRVAANPMAAVPGVGVMPLLDVGGVIGAAGLGVAFLISAARNARALYLAEPLPVDRAGRAA
ncbi:MAG: CDP-alcohol phosphatidyltransferase family protein [Betaproteobacteria bacterium]